ncbi:MAG: 2-oxoglutarate dehydrogenase E1 component [Acidobacteriota bacterium]|nr:2-oxoglutarate dehydrogenase E1 component [Acidobacteriota bacterium]
MAQAQIISPESGSEALSREQIYDLFRRWGYLQADLDPLGHFKPLEYPELRLSGPDADRARQFYCGTVGVEFMHIPDLARRQWIIDRLEAEQPEVDRTAILKQLVEADIFEQMLQTLYIGTKRFSLEGDTALIPLLEEILHGAAGHGCEECLMAMSHRGRLAVVANSVGRTATDIYAGFEDVDPRSILGGGDVKYHQGATNIREINGHKMRIHLVSNPSHLEAVDPVALGRVRAKQTRRGAEGRRQTLPILMHGDSAFAGQGIWAETLNMSYLAAYDVGGSINIIVNNLLGFTTNPEDYASSRYASDLAKRLPIPIFHVNAEDPDAVVRIGRLALEYRYTFGSDVVIDLIGYRRHGHSEVDDPTITQPIVYAKIKAHPPLYEIYAKRLGIDVSAQVAEARARYQAAKAEAKSMTKKPALYQLPAYWDGFFGRKWQPSFEVPTAVDAVELSRLGSRLCAAPAGFHVHPKVASLLKQRVEMAEGKRPVDYGMAEALAFASLVTQGVPIRMSGQDSRRGTFNHRHSYLIDVEDESEYMPLAHLAPEQARIEIYNSELSEAAVLGFEYGFSRDFPESLTLWEAQFGDFANGAQIVIDQFISAGEEKWGLLSGLVLLLPHGYEGQGPEHSSARIERYLQLCARSNMQVCQPSTAAQYFHLLRRQALRKWRKPLVCFTPKSMLRHPDAASPLEQLTRGAFQCVVPDTAADPEKVTRILLCTGKIGHELAVERKKQGHAEAAILSLDQIYPFPEAELLAAIAPFTRAHELVWVQEEPANMGAHSFMMPRLRRVMGSRLAVRSVKRQAAASPATGSAKAHQMEQHALIALAFSS